MVKKGNVMQAYQERVVEEKQELDAKLQRLKDFIDSDAFAQLLSDEQIRMSEQYSIMETYSEILQRRIEAF